MKIYDFKDVDVNVFGDVHGQFDYMFDSILDYTKSVNIIAGDCGFGFHKMAYYEELFERYNQKLVEKDLYILFCRGNHDDSKFFSNELINYSNIKTIPDYSVIRVSTDNKQKNILCIGGATSIDRLNRIENDKYIASFGGSKRTYWEDEQPFFSEEEFNLLKEQNIKIDYVVTHTCPSFAYPLTKDGVKSWMVYDSKLEKDLDIERGIMDNIYNRLKKDNHPIEEWIYGHFHNTYSMEYENTTFKLLSDLRNYYDWGRHTLFYHKNVVDDYFDELCCEGKPIPVLENGLDDVEEDIDLPIDVGAHRHRVIELNEDVQHPEGEVIRG